MVTPNLDPSQLRGLDSSGAVMYILTMNFLPRPCRFRPARLLVALAIGLALGPAGRTAAMGVNWGNVQDADQYLAISFDIQNDNQGTTYNSVTLSSVVPFFEALHAANRACYPTLDTMLYGFTAGRR